MTIEAQAIARGCRRCSQDHSRRLIRSPRERVDLSPEMAIRIEGAFGVSMETLKRIWNSFDNVEARKKAEAVGIDLYLGNPPERILPS